MYLYETLFFERELLFLYVDTTRNCTYKIQLRNFTFAQRKAVNIICITVLDFKGLI